MQGGRIGVVGVYSGYCNHYNIGAFMEKGLTMAAGQVRACMPAIFKSLLTCRVITSMSLLSLCPWATFPVVQCMVVLSSLSGISCGAESAYLVAAQTPVQKYWHDLLKYVKEGSLTPDMVSTQAAPTALLHHLFVGRGTDKGSFHSFGLLSQGRRCAA